MFSSAKQNSSHWAYGWTGAIAFLLFGGGVFAIALLKLEATSPKNISETVGHAEQIESRRGGVYFKLREPNLLFVHHSGELARVSSELSSSRHPVTVRYRNTDPTQPSFREGSFFTVLSIRINEKDVLSEDLVLQHRARDGLLGVAIGVFFLLYGSFRVWRLTR